MSVMTEAGRLGRDFSERFLNALTDPARRERTAAVALLGYVVLWTIYATLAKGGQDIHVDMSEQYVLSRELAWGYPKHPPLAMAIVRAWFAVFPTADWAYYLLANATVGLTLWIVWRLAARYLDGDKRVVGLALLTLVPFFNFHALKFNANTILMPLWAATTLWFLRSFETRRVLDATLAGLCAAAAMYGKYWSIFLLLGLGVAALVDRRRAAYFRSAAPWVTVAVGTAALAPHVAWLIANDFAPFSYALDVHGAESAASTLRAAFGYLAAAIAYLAVPLIILFVATRPSRAAMADTAWPANAERRLAAVAFWAVLLGPALVAPFAGIQLVTIWSMSAWTLLPVVLLSSPLVVIARRNAAHILALAVLFPFVMVAFAPAIAFSLHRAGLPAGATHSSALVGPIEQLWRETTDQPLRVFGGFDEFTDGVSFYMPNHPHAAHVLDRIGSQSDEARISRDGAALLCPVRPRHAPSATACRNVLLKRALCSPEGKRKEVEVSRRFLGVEGRRERYLLVTIPPRGPHQLTSLREPVAEFAATHFPASD